MAELEEQLVGALAHYYGAHPGHRAAHAKGIVCVGEFEGTAEGAALTRAAHLQGAAVPVTVRFSNGSGVPWAPDRSRDRRGMAVRFHLPGGEATDLVAITLPVFFARTPEGFAEFLSSRERAYVAAHPEAARAVELSHHAPLPASYARAAYHAVHAFRWVGAAGDQRWVRCRWEPDAGVATVSLDQARDWRPDELQHELRERLLQGPVVFRLVAAIAEPGDPIDDPTALWPPDRASVVAGVLRIEREGPPEGSAIAFDPTRVTDGIECSPDPLLLARSAAYALSASRRAVGVSTRSSI